MICGVLIPFTDKEVALGLLKNLDTGFPQNYFEMNQEEFDKCTKNKALGCGAGLDGFHYCGEDWGGYISLCDKCESKKDAPCVVGEK